MNRFIYGRTEYCCVCYKIAVHYNGWLIKSRDAVVAGFCDEHAPTEPNLKGTYGQHNYRGIYNKEMGFTTKKLKPEQIRKKYGLDKNLNE